MVKGTEGRICNKFLGLFVIATIFLLHPSSAFAHIPGPGFLVFVVGYALFSYALLVFAIGLIKFVVTSHFYGRKWGVSRKAAFRIIMVDSAVFAAVLLGATPFDIKRFLPSSHQLLNISEWSGILAYYLSSQHPVLFGSLLSALVALPVLYPLSAYINSLLFRNGAQAEGNNSLFKTNRRLALKSAAITPIGICLVLVIIAVPAVTESKAALDSLFEDAVVEADTDMAMALLRHGANVNAGGRYGGGNLVTAFAFGRMPSAGSPDSMVRFLLDSGADINAVSERGTTTLMEASAGAGRLEEYKLLIDRKPNIHAVDREGNEALHYALRGGQIDKAALLIANGADIDKKNKDGQTVLMTAAQEGRCDIVRFLIEKNADIHLRDNCGLTALRKATQADHKEVAEILLAHGGDPNDMIKGETRCGRVVAKPLNIPHIPRRR